MTDPIEQIREALAKPLSRKIRMSIRDDCTTEEAEATASFIAVCSPAAIQTLLDRLDAAEKDAARYRWLRRAREHWDILHRDDEDSNFVDLHGNDLDAAIDAAREAEK